MRHHITSALLILTLLQITCPAGETFLHWQTR